MYVYPGVTLSSATNSSPILIGSSSAILYGTDIDPARALTSLGLVCKVSAGASLTYSVQISADPPTSSIVNWIDHDVITGKTSSIASNILYPVTAVRLAVTVWASGSVSLGVAQWP